MKEAGTKRYLDIIKDLHQKVNQNGFKMSKTDIFPLILSTTNFST
jgi:hypothetical protein